MYAICVAYKCPKMSSAFCPHTRGEPFDILNFDVLTNLERNDDPPNCYYAISELGH